jgi:hypothetical protein
MSSMAGFIKHTQRLIRHHAQLSFFKYHLYFCVADCLPQDTRRLLQSEATALSAELKRRQTAARLAADRDTAAQLGLSDLGRLGERLAGKQVMLWVGGCVGGDERG